MLRYRTAPVVPEDSLFERGWRAGLHGGSPLFGASTPARAREYQRGYEGGRQERQRVAAVRARAAAPLPKAVYADAFLRGAVRGQRSGMAQFGASDPRVAQAYAAGFRAVQAGHVLTDRSINWRSGWGVVPLTTNPGDIRALARALDAER